MPRFIARLSIGTVLFALFALLVISPPAQAAFPGANGKIAFVRILTPAPDDFDYEIFTMSPDGTGITNLTNTPGETDDELYPAWSPDGSKIAFNHNFDDEIYVMNADGTDVRNLTHNPAPDTHPAWSPDGTRIAFTSTRSGGSPDIWTMSADGSNPKRLTNTPDNEADPAWSPDGSKIAFVGCVPDACGGNGFPREDTIFTMNADGSGVTRVGPRGSSEPAWSPDGTRIAAFVTGPPCRISCQPPQIWTFNPDGTGTAILSRGSWPAWSPDGSKIAFEGSGRIWMMNADGTGQVNITNGPDLMPDWGPIPTAPQRSNYKNAAEFCKAERDFLGEAAFADKYGTNHNLANSYENCVSQNH